MMQINVFELNTASIIINIIAYFIYYMKGCIL